MRAYINWFITLLPQTVESKTNTEHLNNKAGREKSEIVIQQVWVLVRIASFTPSSVENPIIWSALHACAVKPEHVISNQKKKKGARERENVRWKTNFLDNSIINRRPSALSSSRSGLQKKIVVDGRNRESGRVANFAGAVPSLSPSPTPSRMTPPKQTWHTNTMAQMQE